MNDPYYFKDIARFVECSGSFVLQITDGESTYDQNIPLELQDYDLDGNDGAVYLNNGSDYLDDVALWANTTDLRPDDEPGGLEGTQNLIYYTVFAFGQGSTLLKDAARNGGFKDVKGDGMPEPPDGDPETIRLEWDKDQDGDPDTYFEAPSGFELERKIYQAITAILKRAASGTAVSVLSTSERGEGTVYQAFFKPKTSEGGEDIKWLGYLQGLWIDEKGNLREDTEADGRLVLEEDKILRYRFDLGTQQTFVDRFTDADGDGKIDNLDENGDPVPDDSILLENMEGIWEAGKLPADQSPDLRRIFTFADSDWNQVADETEIFEFSTDAVSLPAIAPYLETLGTDPISYSYLGPEADRANNLVQFIRGYHVEGMRNRRVTVDGVLRTWKLGDIVYSTPTVVGPPLAAYERIYSDPTYLEYATRWKDREGMLFIGANDGMLHAFRTGSFISGDDPSTTTKEEVGYLQSSYGDVGSEAWADIPFNLLPHLKWLADPDYTHVFYTDLKVKVGDVKIFPEDSDHPNGWGTLLIGGMRLGGGPYPSGEVVDGSQKYYRSAFFLMDITDSNNPVILAEFSHPEMGFTTSYPTITKIDDQWFMVMGSGPSPGASPPYNYDGTSDQFAKIFVLNLTMFMSTKQIREGQELTVINGFIDNAFMSDPVSVDKDLDFNVDVIYFGETAWVSNKWKGRIYRLKTGEVVNPADWQLSSLFITPTYKSISAAPGVAAGFNESLWVYFGTGRFANDDDKVDVNVQSLYGFHDVCMDPGAVCATTYDEGVLYDVTDFSVYTRSHAGEYELNYRSETYPASYWNIFLEGHFSAPEWIVFLLESKKNVMSPLAQFRKIFTAVIVITLGIVLLLSIRQIRRSTVPIEILREGTQKVSEGDLGHQVEIKSGDEFENLGHSFNKMSSKLKEDQALLIQTAKMSAIGQMAAGIVHEINQPLSAMFGLVQLTLMEEPEGRRKERLQQIEKSIERLGEIARKFKSFSRSAEERMYPVHVNDPLIQVVDLLKHQLTMKGVACEQDLADDLPMISGDANGLQQVFMNIIINAVDAFENEQIIKKIVKIKTGTADGRVFVMIEDNGCGIPDDLKNRIFDPFFTTKNVDKGTGLGLAIIESILHKHGATIKLDSEVGTGTRFSIYFPAVSSQTITD